VRSLKAFLLGATAVGAIAYALLATLALGAQRGGRTFDLALGPLRLVAVAREGAVVITTFGPGLIVLAVVGGIANLVTATVLRHRSDGRLDRVD
jgi:hypothetical protein